MPKKTNDRRKHTKTYQQLGLNIAYYRRAQNITQEGLAEMVDVSRSHISNIEALNMNKTFSLNLLLDIADALGVDVVKFFEIR